MYMRWHAAPGNDLEDDGEQFPNLDEFEVEFENEDGDNSRVITTVSHKRRKYNRKRAAQCIRHYDVTTKTILFFALCCSLCICIGLTIGYMIAKPPQPKATTNSTVPVEKIIVAPPHSPPRFRNRHFSASEAVHFESYLTNSVLESYVSRLNRVPMSDIPSYVATTLRYQGLSTKTVSFSASISLPDSENPNTVTLGFVNKSSLTINDPRLEDGSLPYAAYSPPGDISGTVVYGHRGSAEDLDILQKLRVKVSGNIVLLRHVSDSEAAQVMRAENAGAIGVLFYPDPREFSGNGTQYPNGTGLPDDGVLFPTLKMIPGDPATIFYPSVRHVYRKPLKDLEGVLPKIPVQPISYKTAKILLTSLGGIPPPTSWINSDPNNIIKGLGGAWSNSSKVENIRMVVNNLIEERLVTNVHAWLPCDDATKVIHIGAAQANTGSAVFSLAALLAIGQALSDSYQATGRRIMLSAWAETHVGFIGSTEFTELQRTWLEHTALAYLNIGPKLGSLGGLRVRGSPLLHEIIREASHQVSWPKQEALSVIEGWRMGDGKEYDIAFENLGCSCDAVSFSATLGVPAVQFSIAQPMHPSTCKEGYCEVCYDTRSEHPLSNSQYDTTSSATTLLDPGLDWSTALASLVGTTALVLSESPIPPVNFKADFSGGLVDGWWSFLHNHLYALNNTPYNFTKILDAIRHELYDLQTKMEEVSVWYNRRPTETDTYLAFRHDEDRLNYFIELSRNLLGPRGIERKFTTSLTGPSDLLESFHHSPHDKINQDNSNETLIPSHIIAIQTDAYFSNSEFNNLSFSRLYREEDKSRPHIFYPQISAALRKALSGSDSFENLHKELSILLSALRSLRNFLPLK